MINLKNAREIEKIARAGSIVAGLFREVEPLVAPGRSTEDLNAFCDDFIRSHEGAVPTFKGLYGFPASVCVSVNEEVVHGIPKPERSLEEGDIVSLDVGVTLDGWVSDSAWTFPVGEVSEETRHLLTVTRESLDLAVAAAVPGKHVGDIGAAVVERVDGTGLSIIRDLVGHGVGRELHEEPQVPNVGRKGYGPRLQEGMVLAIEPMLAAGDAAIRTLEDRWTVVSGDGSRTAHYEHTVAITAEGPRILTTAEDPASAPA